MKIEVKVPVIGESVTQAQIAAWLVSGGSFVEKNSEIAEIESDKATLAISAPESGIINILIGEGETVIIGQVIALIDMEKSAEPTAIKSEVENSNDFSKSITKTEEKIRISPLAKNLITQNHLSLSEIAGKNPDVRIRRKNVEDFLKKSDIPEKTAIKDKPGTERKKMSALRIKLAERLISVRQNTAMLTTFNEVNMGSILKIKEKHGDSFKSKFGFSLGFVSFFAKACATAIKDFPVINAKIDNDDIVYHHYVDINIAVSSPKGLITPVIKDIDSLSVPEIEKQIKELGLKASKNRIALDDLSIGTFTVTNGGVFGSLMSTPMINPPQSAILGMHKVADRPVVIDGNIVIQPMMYIALSYDHRLIDGKESVGFVIKVKELLETPLESGLVKDSDFDKLINL